MSECTFYYNTGIETPGCPPIHQGLILPTWLDFYVYGFPVLMSMLILLAFAYRYAQIKREIIRRLIIEQPT